MSKRSRKRPNMSQSSRKFKAQDTEEVDYTPLQLPGILIDPTSIPKIISKLSETINDPEYQEQLRKIMLDSIRTSLSSLQRLGQFTTQVTQLDSRGLSSLINGSVSEVMRANLQFSSDLMLLLQKHSDRLIQILEEASSQGGT